MKVNSEITWEYQEIVKDKINFLNKKHKNLNFDYIRFFLLNKSKILKKIKTCDLFG